MKITISPVSHRNHTPRSFDPLLALCSAIALTAGCVSEPESHVVSGPPPPAPVLVAGGGAVVATTQPMTTTTQTTQQTPNGGTIVTTQTQPAGTIIVQQAPPAMVTEVVVARPSSSHVWIAGYWTWRENKYQWVAGHWTIPPYANATWTPPRWHAESGAYRFYEGAWN